MTMPWLMHRRMLRRVVVWGLVAGAMARLVAAVVVVAVVVVVVVGCGVRCVVRRWWSRLLRAGVKMEADGVEITEGGRGKEARRK